MRQPTELAELARILATRAIQGQGGTPIEPLGSAGDSAAVCRHLYTYDETATALACSTRTVKRLIASKALRSVHLDGGAARIRATDLSDYVADLSQSP